jgi:hypothetical protein
MSAFPAEARKVLFAAMLLLSAYAPVALAGSSELPVSVDNTDHEIGDRVRIRSKIMRVDAGKQTLLVAEKEVRLLEHYPEVRNLKTRLLDEEGKPAEFTSFKEGDTVLVLGYCEPNGHVYAVKVQRVDSTVHAPEPAGRHPSQLQRSNPRMASRRAEHTVQPAAP